MGLTMSERKAVIKAWASQYQKADKKEKGRILDEIVKQTAYNRWYVVGLLRWDGYTKDKTLGDYVGQPEPEVRGHQLGEAGCFRAGV